MEFTIRMMRSLGARVAFRIGVGVIAILLTMAGQAARAESPADAVARIRRGPHAAMPPPQTAHATGGPGEGMTIENGTGHLLRVHFSGSATRTVDVPDGQSKGVELAVGSYEVAAEVPGSAIMPFYGTQSYQPRTHYWLKFFVQRQLR